MTDQPTAGPSTRPWYRTGWGITYLSALGIALLVALIQAVIPLAGRGAEFSLGKAASLMPVSIALDVLLAIPIGVWAFRRRFWRHPRSVLDVLLGLLLFALGTAAAAGLIFATCAAVSQF